MTGDVPHMQRQNEVAKLVDAPVLRPRVCWAENRREGSKDSSRLRVFREVLENVLCEDGPAEADVGLVASPISPDDRTLRAPNATTVDVELGRCTVASA